MNSEEKLKQLKERNEELKPIVFVGFKTKEELFSYEETIQSEKEEYFSNLKEIERLEWELLTPEERKKIEEQKMLSKLKRDGKLYEYLIAQKRKE